MTGAAKLRLKAEDGEDLSVISAVLQDALVLAADMEFFEADKRFVMIANRFRWETADADGGAEIRPGTAFERVNCGVTFEGVTAVRRRNIDRKGGKRTLSVLAVQKVDGEDAIDIVFSDAGRVRLEAAAINCRLEDFDEPWPTRHRPDHDAGHTGT